MFFPNQVAKKKEKVKKKEKFRCDNIVKQHSQVKECVASYFVGVINVLMMTDMRRWMTMVFLIVAVQVSGADDDGEFMRAVLALTGCLNVEELGEYEVERYSDFYGNPLEINKAPKSNLLSSGLFSSYQVAVLTDYRELSGDILSFEELSSLDGFGYDFVSALRYFVSLESSSPPGHSSSSSAPVRNSATLKSGVRNTGAGFSPEGMYAAKYRIAAGGYFEAGISLRSSWQDRHFPPEKYFFFAAYYGRRFPGKVILGDFSLRFGQGLALWPGFSMSGVSSPDAFSRRPSGIAPYNSYSGEGAFRGLAADFGIRHFNASVFVSGLGLRGLMDGMADFSKDILYGMNLGWYGMAGEVSLTCFAVSPLIIEISESQEAETIGFQEYFHTAKISADARFSVRGADFFGEAACDVTTGVAAVLAGVSAGIADDVRMAAMFRYYPPGYSAEYSGAARSGTKCANEYGFSAAVSHSSGKWMDIAGKKGFGSSEKRFRGTVSADASYSPEPKSGVDTSSFQFKFLMTETVRLSPYFSMGIRVSERYRTYGRPFRTDVRADMRSSFSRWNVCFRLNVLHCSDLSFLSYLEGGYKTDILTLWLRAGLFRVDDWDDRIYAYERDAPGSFSVPAYYGRGYWVALSGGWKCARGIRLYFRTSFQDYPWLRPSETEKKPAKAEIRLQLAVDLWKSRSYRRNS